MSIGCVSHFCDDMSFLSGLFFIAFLLFFLTIVFRLLSLVVIDFFYSDDSGTLNWILGLDMIFM